MVAGVPIGLTGGEPPSDGVCLCQSATSCRPTRSAFERLISRASGTARSANFVLCSSFQIWPAPSIASGMVAAPIAGERSAPRNRLRVITVTVGSLRFLASVTAGSASTVSAATNSAVMALVSILSDMDGLSSSASSGRPRYEDRARRTLAYSSSRYRVSR